MRLSQCKYVYFCIDLYIFIVAEMKNNVVFPKGFEPTLEWSIDFGRQVKKFAQERGDNLYLMPIRGNVQAYLEGIMAE